MRRCLHDDVRFCPLYHACHEPGAVDLGCDDGELHTGVCAVARGLSYERNIEHLRVRCPGLVEQLEWRHQAELMRTQRTRNLRLNGIH